MNPEVKSGAATMVAVRVWDVPLRLFHWLLVALVCLSVATGKVGGNAMKWHMYSGYGVLFLLLFRLLWGIFGGSYARFSHFLRGPAAVRGYACGLFLRQPSHTLGHNPLGGLMVALMLAVLLFQAGSGLFSNDDIATEGPLYAKVGKDLSDRITTWHKLNSNLVLALAGLHVAAVFFYLGFKGENLVRPMISGWKQVPEPPRQPARFPGPWRAATLATVAGAATYLIINS
ncbi:MAG TPA: cytochrome b/b6 domain-containing protein [Burkholderiales bacterium]